MLSLGEVHGQQARDSLLQTFTSIRDDSLRIDSMTRISVQLGFGGDAALGIWLAEQAGEEAHRINNHVLEVTSLLTIGAIYNEQGTRDMAMKRFLEALKLSEATGYVNGRGSAWNNIASIQSQEEHFEDALVSLRKARKDFLSTSNKQNACGVLLNIASVYSDLQQLDKAILTFDSVLKEMAQFDAPGSYAILYQNLGSVYQEQKQHPKALECFNLAIQYAEKAEDLYGLSESHISRGNTKFALGDPAGARTDVLAGIADSKLLGAPELEARGYKALSEFAKTEGKPGEALEWLERSIHISDSIHTSERNAALANMQAIYAVELKDAEISMLNKDKAVQTATVSKGRYLNGLLGLGLVATVTVVFFLFLSNRTRQRVNRSLGEKNVQISEQKEEILAQNAELKYQNERLEDLNREMDGILHVVAHDLKAPLNQTAGLVNLIMDDGQLSDAQLSYLEMIVKVNDNAGKLVRDLVEVSKLESEKEPMQLETLDLVAFVREAVSFLTVEAQRKAIALELNLPTSHLVIASERSFLVRILDNLITNAIKFSKRGTSVVIGLEPDEKGVTIEIRDQGPGISTEDQGKLFKKFQQLSARPTGGESSTGLGLAIVQALVLRLNGTIHVHSKLGEGTSFRVWIPR